MAEIAYSLDEASRTTSISVSELKRAIRSGQLKAKKLGHRVIIPHDDLAQFIGSLNDWEQK